MRIGRRYPHPTKSQSARKINGRMYLFVWNSSKINVYRHTGVDRKPWALVHSL